MKNRQYVLTVTLNPAIDKTIVIPHFRRGVIYRPDTIGLSAGGKGINVSKVLSQLGVNTLASGFLPQKGADFIHLELDSHKIKHHFIEVPGEVRTNMTILNPASKRATRIFEPGGRVRKADIQRFKKEYIRLIKNASVVIISGSHALGVPDDLDAQLISLAHRQGIPTVLDTSFEPLRQGLQRSPFLVKPNLEEAEDLLGCRLKSEKSIKSALVELYRQGALIVALSDGKKGAYLYNGTDFLRALPPVIEQKNPVGCGDAFVGGFIAGYLKKNFFIDCVKFASACGCVNAMSINPGEISSAKVNNIFRRIQVSNL